MKQVKRSGYLLPLLGAILAGCGGASYEFDTVGHISAEKVTQAEPDASVDADVPDLVGSTAALPQLSYEGPAEVFDVVVDNISVRDVLLSLADQAQLDLDVDPFVQGVITLNAYGQTVEQILERIRAQLSLRYERVGTTLVVMQDSLYIKQYHMTFPDLQRSYTASVDGTVPSSGTASLGSSSISNAKTGSGSVWLDLEDTITTILVNTAPVAGLRGLGPAGEPQGAAQTQDADRLDGENLRTDQPANIPFVHTLPDAGLIILFGDSKQHQLIGDIIAKVTESSRRQVLLQATVVEIALSNQYQQGIDWSVFNSADRHPKLYQGEGFTGPVLDFPSNAAIDNYRTRLQTIYGEPEEGSPLAAFIQEAVEEYSLRDLAQSSAGGFFNATFGVGDLTAAVSLLDKFGDTKVVSSPRISTLNGQPAILKVVEDNVYFEIETTRERADNVETTTYNVEQQIIPTGFVVSVYPQIGADGTIILSMRPSISRVTGIALQPTVGTGGLVSNSGVPIVSVKEIETLMLLNEGQTAVMGGLIEDRQRDADTQVPGAGSLPVIGNLFKNIDEQTDRVEYVIFVTATIVRNPSIYGDYSEFRDLLPSDETFKRDTTGAILNKDVESVPRTR